MLHCNRSEKSQQLRQEQEKSKNNRRAKEENEPTLTLFSFLHQLGARQLI